MTPRDNLLDIQLDDNGTVPLWLQLRNRLVYLISSGQIAIGTKLPTVRELAVDLQIHYNTVSKVYQDLEKDGYITSKRGRGTFVDSAYLANRNAAANPAESLTDQYIQECSQLGLNPEELPGLVWDRVRLMYWASAGRESQRAKTFLHPSVRVDDGESGGAAAGTGAVGAVQLRAEGE